MYRRKLDLRSVLMLLAVGLFWLGAAQTFAQTEEPAPPDTEVTQPDETPPEVPTAEDPGEDPGEEPAEDPGEEPAEEPADATNPPRYITDLMEAGDLTDGQVADMREDGLGWGEIRIAARLAEEIAAASEGTDTELTFEEALASVLEARAAGKGFGEIAGENDLKVGDLVNSRNRKMGAEPGDSLEAQRGVQAGETKRVTTRNRGLLARIGSFLGFGRKERVAQDLKPTDIDKPAKTERVQKAEKIQKMERVQKVERIAKVERPERPARPERPSKFEKPERPDRPGRGR